MRNVIEKRSSDVDLSQRAICAAWYFTMKLVPRDRAADASCVSLYLNVSALKLENYASRTEAQIRPTSCAICIIGDRLMARRIANWWSRIMGTPSPTAERGKNPFNLHPGDKLETVLLSVIHDGCLRIWRSKGVPEVRRLDAEGAAVVQKVLGRSVFARTSPEPNRYREVGLLDAENQLLCLPDRMMIKNGASNIKTWTRICRATLTTPPGPMDIQAWKDWGNWLNVVILDAASWGSTL